MPKRPPPQLTWIISVALIARIALNTARRFAYPFAPALSRGMNVPLPAITSMIALNQGTGLLGLFFGPLSDHLGYRRMLIGALSLLVLGMLAGAMFPCYLIVMAALFLAGIGKTIFDPAIQAYVGARVSYQRRGLVVGIIEIGWAGSSLIGLPLIGILITRFGWQAPFWALALLGGLSLIAIILLVPREHRPGTTYSWHANLWSNLRALLRERSAIGMLSCGFFVNAANNILFVVYGSWLESTFKLSVIAIGMSAVVIGIAELAGEGFTALFADRLGLQRAIILGLGLSGLGYIALIFSNHHLPLALGAIFLIFIAVEFTIVSSLSLSTELLTTARATMLAGYLAAANAGRMIGALMGGPIWLAGGILAIGITSSVLSGLGLVFLSWGTLRNTRSPI